MSTIPGPSGIPLSHHPDGTGYKLLELQSELLELLESENPPATLTIHPSPTAALLKTPGNNKTYSLRQKNTSNALILLKPAEYNGNPRKGGETETEEEEISAIATVHEMIELVPEESDVQAPTPKARGKWHEKFGRTR
ncbi:hypothetical protein QBC35DRAFT_184150 [Podospora australis]|uniref:Sister chromatid cohesion protein DCC1 n=1 Tax=Podospora australis TaxID=1536484 RepID=A0AAN7AJ95_9PEZI|nr:hypothetical protein QBC35DRAFT_184150 [Podospora australis]